MTTFIIDVTFHVEAEDIANATGHLLAVLAGDHDRHPSIEAQMPVRIHPYADGERIDQ